MPTPADIDRIDLAARGHDLRNLSLVQIHHAGDHVSHRTRNQPLAFTGHDQLAYLVFERLLFNTILHTAIAQSMPHRHK